MKRIGITLGIAAMLMLAGIVGAAHVATAQAAASPCATTIACQNTAGIKQAIHATFGADAPDALRIATCESGLNPNAYNPASGTMGLFQFAPGTWRRTPFAHDNPFAALSNIRAAYYLFVHDGHSWREWECR